MFLTSSKFLFAELDDDYVTAQCVLILWGGLETASSAHCFMAHELAADQDVQEKLYEEILKISRDLDGNALTYETLNKMTYMDMVISESLRKWSVIPIIDRVVSKPYEFDNGNGRKIRLNVGDAVVIPIDAIHMDENYFSEPTKFDPERFNSDNVSKIRPFTYLPFGKGLRNCVRKFFLFPQQLFSTRNTNQKTSFY